MSYAVRADIEARFGSTNVAKWADMNNNANAGEITARIDWALAEATIDLDARLRHGPYVVPFVVTYDPIIVSLCAQLAGVILYESRGITDFNPTTGATVHSLAWHKAEVHRKVKAILAGQYRIGATSVPATYPQVVLDDES